jgi:Fe-S cluster biogenesis protein NfuA
MSADVISVDEALASFREMMATDGYLLTWSDAGDDKVVVKIAATDGACEDCLVPLPIMTNIMAKALASTTYELDHVELPGAVH